MEYKKDTNISGLTLFFTADWCGPCNALKKTLAKEEAEDLRDLVLFVDVESKAGSKLADKFEISSMPTLVRPDGKKHEGVLTLKALRAFINKSGPESPSRSIRAQASRVR